MKMIGIKRAVLLMICNLAFWSLSDAQNMYASGPVTTPELTTHLNSYNPIGVYALHGNAPDSLTNNTNVNIIVEIRDNNGNLHPGLKRKSDPNPVKELGAGNSRAIDRNRFRRGMGPDKKVELVITIPGRQKPDGSWDLKRVDWNLGPDHNPTYTKLKYLGREEGYQIIFVYENGLQKTDPDDLIPEFHVQGHLCEPDDPVCDS